MNRIFALTLFNAVYFGFAVIGYSWFLVTYGLGLNATALLCAAVIVYFVLCVVEVLAFFRRTLTRDPSFSLRTSVPGAYFSPRAARAARITCLVLPLFAWCYIASFFLVQNTFCSPGGVWRYSAFHGVEVFLFGKAKCLALIPAAVRRHLDSYLDEVFSPRVIGRFHSPCLPQCHHPVRCSFRVEKSGAIREKAIAESSGNEDIDEAALIALDGNVPPLPAGSPDYVSIDFVFETRVCAGIKWSRWPKVKYPMAEELIRRARACVGFENYPEAKTLLLDCLEGRRAQFGNDASCLVPVLMELGDLSMRMGLLTQVDPYYDEALAIAERNMDGDMTQYQDVVWGYAGSCCSRKLYKKALDLYERYKSAASFDLTDRSFNIRYAQALYGSGDYKAATAIFASLLQRDEITFGNSDNSILIGETLAMCDLYIKQGAQQKVIALVNSLLSLSKENVDKSNRMDRLNALQLAADIYEKLKDRKSQRKALEEALSLSTARSGPLALGTIERRTELASCLWQQDRKDEAVKLFERLAAGFSEKNPDRANALFHLSAFYFRKGLAEKAQKPLQDALRIRSKLYGEASDRTNTVKCALAQAFEGNKDYFQAKKVVSTLVVSELFDPFFIACQNAHSYRNLGDFSKAIEIYETLLQEVSTSDRRVYETETLYESLIDLSRAQHDDLRLEHYLNEQSELALKQGHDSSRFALIEFYLERKQFAKAEELCDLEVNGIDLDLKWHSAQEIRRLANSFVLLAKVYYLQQRMQPAKYYLRRALSLLEPYGRSQLHIVTAGLLANLLAQDGDLAGAEKLLSGELNGELSSTVYQWNRYPVEGFHDLQNTGTQTMCYSIYKNPDKSERFDPEMSSPGGAPILSAVRNEKKLVAMVDMNWELNSSMQSYDFLKIATLSALASIQERLSAMDECVLNRSNLLDLVEGYIIEYRKDNRYFDCDSCETLIKKSPPSDRREEVLEKLRKFRIEQDIRRR